MTKLIPANYAAKVFNIEASALTKYIQPCPLIQPLPIFKVAVLLFSVATSYEENSAKGAII